MMLVVLRDIKKIIEESKSKSPISLSEDSMILNLIGQFTIFNLSFELYSDSRKIKTITYEEIFKKWKTLTLSIHDENDIESYFNTYDPHFNNNAYFWHINLKNNNLFQDKIIPFKILSEYLNFRSIAHKPVTAVDTVEKLMSDYNLNKEQKLFIFDKLNGLIMNADENTQSLLSKIMIEILDRRWIIEPLDISEEQKRYNIDSILEESKTKKSIEEQISFLKRKQLELKKDLPKDELGFIQGLIDQIQIDIDILLTKLDANLLTINKEYFDSQFNRINKKQNLLYNKVSEIYNISREIETRNSDFFENKKEENDFLVKAKELLPINDNSFSNWVNEPIKTKIKVVIPLLFIRLEREMEIRNISFPKSWKDLKNWFLRET